MAIHIGCSGWSYNHWQGILYPQGASSRTRLDYYIHRFHTVEVNSSYYHWPRDATFANWREYVPEGFIMTIKAPRGLTHSAKLNNPEVWIERLDRGLKLLGDRMGMLLVQLSPHFGPNLPRLDHFLTQMPDWIRVAMEFRHPAWHTEEVFELLERHGAAYCTMSGANLPCISRVTAPFVYLRFHGPDPNHMYGGSYTKEDLEPWAERMLAWAAEGREVFAYFNNDWHGHAIRDADTLLDLTGAEGAPAGLEELRMAA